MFTTLISKPKYTVFPLVFIASSPNIANYKFFNGSQALYQKSLLRE